MASEEVDLDDISTHFEFWLLVCAGFSTIAHVALPDTACFSF